MGFRDTLSYNQSLTKTPKNENYSIPVPHRELSALSIRCGTLSILIDGMLSYQETSLHFIDPEVWRGMADVR